eukprot:GHRR01005742.1.p1 GENE.GHRR01005742.1~~GHRR01005742.1.p1  ORF type:complete len:1212 (+),score=577.85 GHRR01005742.1:442-4077(+)
MINIRKALATYRSADPASGGAVANALLGFLQDGLQGNRAVSGIVWSVVTAATRAFPIQLSPSVEKAKAVAEAFPGVDLLQTWILQAAADGSLIVLLKGINTQPQILTAYAHTALVRNHNAVEEVISLLQEHKNSNLVAPYDATFESKLLVQCVKPAASAYIETEQDVKQRESSSDAAAAVHSQQLGTTHSSQLKQQGQHIQPSATYAAGTAGSKSPNRKQQRKQQQNEPTAKSGLAGRLASTHLPFDQLGGKSKSSKADVAQAHSSQQRQHPQQQDRSQPGAAGSGASLEGRLVEVKLQVIPTAERMVCQKSPSDAKAVADQVVHVQLRPLSQAQLVSSAYSNSTSSNSSNKLSGTAAVKGLLHGLQLSATAGLQQGVAARQELSGAVAAALSQPLAVVKEFAARANRSAQATVKTGQSGSTSTSISSSISKSDAVGGGLQDMSAGGRSFMSRLPSFLSKRSAITADAGGAGNPSAEVDTSSGSSTDQHHTVQVLLQVLNNGDNCEMIKVVLSPVSIQGDHNGSRISQVIISAGKTGSKQEWQAPGLLSKFSRKDRPMTTAAAQQQQQQQQMSSGKTVAAAAEAGLGLDSAHILEGDMWSVMTRLKGSNALQTAEPADTAHSLTAAAEAEAVQAEGAEGARQRREVGRVLLQQLLVSCDTVLAAAAAIRGCLGEDCKDLMQLIGLIKDLLHHGLISSSDIRTTVGANSSVKRVKSPAVGSDAAASAGLDSSSDAHDAAGTGTSSRVQGVTAAAKDMLGSWLSSRSAGAFGVLQALQHGSQQHPRLMLGADGIANMKAAKASTHAVKLDMWVRASLNEQLLGVRMATLSHNSAPLQPYYHQEALLLQQQAMQQLLPRLNQLSQHRFALLVEFSPTSQAGVIAGVGDAGQDSKAVGHGAFDPRRLLGGVGAKIGTFGRAAAAGLPGAGAPTAKAVAAASTAAAKPGISSDYSSSIPAFLWNALGATGGAAAAAANDSNIAASGLLCRRRLANIREVRVPPPNSAAVLSPEPSCTLSPVSAADDAAYAQWWSPHGSSQDLGDPAAVAAAIEEPSSSEMQNNGGADLGNIQLQCQGVSQAHTAGKIGSSEAAFRLEQELFAAMNGPLQPVLGLGSIMNSSSGGVSGSSGGGASRTLHRSSSSAGWEAAVAAARARKPTTAAGFPGVYATGQLHRRSRSPEAQLSSSAAGHDSERRVRHMHKRSSSLNDLPELLQL